MPGRPHGSAAALVPTIRPVTRDAPACLRLLNLVLVGLSGSVPLEADDDMTDADIPSTLGRQRK
jgi:hypothetical protein